MAIINFQLVTPERTLLSKELTSLTCPTPQGDITILPNHIPLVSNLIPGELHAKTANEDFYIHVAGGFVEVKPGNKVVVLADAAEHFHEINVERAEEAKKRAEKAMKEKSLSAEEYAVVSASLQKSLSRISIARKRASKKNSVTGDSTYGE
jgi:F-type H+-transporting ATPase subunit epsilon